jgi:hypothetical protein
MGTAMLDDVDLDHAIDEVAREMTDARVDDNFARRVAVRIENVAVRATPRWSRRWLLVPATAGVLLLAVFLVRGERSPSSVRRTASATATAIKKPETVAAAGVATGSTSTAAVAQVATLRPVVASRAASPAAASADPDFQPLTTAPIEVAAIDVSPQLGVMPIEISTIAIDRIDIAQMP